jgi:hypothetical protein
MKATNTNYDFKNSRDRLNNILNASNSSFEELKEIPSREKLTFTN